MTMKKRPKEDTKDRTARLATARSISPWLAAGIWFWVVALAPLFHVADFSMMGLASASPVAFAAAAAAGNTQEGSGIDIDGYSIAIILGEAELTLAENRHGEEGVFGQALLEAFRREGIEGQLETPEGFLESLKSGSSPYSGAIISPWLDVTPELARGLASFARLGGDLALLGEPGIFMGREDVGVGLPIFSPLEPYELYELTGVTAVKPTGALAELGIEPDLEPGFGDAGSVTIQGHSAVGYVYPFASRYWPLLSADDEHGRTRGWAAGVLVHQAGPYAGGHWLISGVTTPSFYLDDLFVGLTSRAFARFRSGELIARVQAENMDKFVARERFRGETPAPPGSITVSDDGAFLVTATGEPFFMIGANYAGPFGHGFGFGDVDVEAIEADFRKARWAGINAFRLWSAADASSKLKSVLSEMARKYGIYLLIVLPHPADFGTDQQYVSRLRRIVRTWADEPMVIGYDLANEPDIQRIGQLRYGGEPSAVLALKPFETFQQYLDRRKIEDEVRSNAYPGNPRYTRHEENLHLRSARDLWLGLVTGPLTARGRDYSTFTAYDGTLKVPAALAPLHEAVDATFGQWIGLLAGVIREIAPHQLVTVGYDQPYALLDANEALDFVNHHVYQRPTSMAEVEKNLTTMDRLRLRWPQKPVSFGEFGYSSGYRMPDGKMLDPHTAAVGEIMFYLDGFAKGYSGAMIWMLNERPTANMRHNESWMQDPDLRYEERFGLFYYDGGGTLEGKPKPIAHATRFFAQWAEDKAPGVGEFLLTRSNTRIGAGYVFQADDALFVGDVAYDGPGLSFASDKAANVMLRWEDERIYVMATADVTVRLNPSRFVSGMVAENAVVHGKHGGGKKEGEVLVIDLLEGETLIIAME